MMEQTLNFEELHDSVIGDVVTFKSIFVTNGNDLYVGIYEKGTLEVLEIGSHLIMFRIAIGKLDNYIYITAFKNDDFKLELTY